MHKIPLKNKGFTLIELLAVIVILSIIALIATPVIIGLIDDARKESFKSSSYGIIVSAENGFAKTLLKPEGATLTEYEYNNGVETKVQGNIELTYNGRKPYSGTILINGQGQTALALYQDGYCATKDYEESEITLEKIDAEDCLISEVVPGGTYTYYDEIKEVNKPQLATGMTPIKWNGTTWVDTTEIDTDWYSYTTTDKKWANAKTADGSMWVWIPRYVYRISSGWHSSTTGIIDVQFSIDTDDTRDGTVTLDVGTTANASNNKWTNHPAFTFGTTELAGIWVAKFEASGTTSAVDFKPNVISLRNTLIGDMFIATRNIETNSRYGWGTSGTNIDTHMMKNSEWGAVTYLSKSTYGKNAEIWINPNSNYTTGCAGASVSAASTTSCNTYDTTNGQQASTTGNIYGVYDMSGGSYEYTSAYVNNGDATLATNGSSIISANAKYKDIYTVTSDSDIDNYNNFIDKKGDAMYETSSSYTGSASWFNDYSYSPKTSSPWFHRGGHYSHTAGAGAFIFSDYDGGANIGSSFRSVLLVGSGL